MPYSTLTGEKARRIATELMPRLYVPKPILDLVGNPELVYFKVVEDIDRGEYAVMYLFTWNKQALPPHPYDYEPVVAIVDRNLNVKEVYTDATHYYVLRQKAPKDTGYKKIDVIVDTPWRSMHVEWSGVGDDSYYVRLKPRYMAELTDNVVKMLKSNKSNPLKIHEAILENPFTVRGASHWQYYKPPHIKALLEEIYYLYIRPLLRRVYTAVKSVL
jgi:hypothetical protein